MKNREAHRARRRALRLSHFTAHSRRRRCLSATVASFSYAQNIYEGSRLVVGVLNVSLSCSPMSISAMLTRIAFTLILALTSVAHPLVYNSNRRDTSLISLPVYKRLDLRGSTKLIHHDQHRATNLFGGLISQLGIPKNDASSADEVSATNTLVSYTVQVNTRLVRFI